MSEEALQPEMNEYGEVISPISNVITTDVNNTEVVDEEEVASPQPIGTTSGGDAPKTDEEEEEE